jgi:hypothetical protein
MIVSQEKNGVWENNGPIPRAFTNGLADAQHDQCVTRGPAADPSLFLHDPDIGWTSRPLR